MVCPGTQRGAPAEVIAPTIRALYTVMAAVGRYPDDDLRLHEVFGVVGGGSAADAPQGLDNPGVPAARSS